MDSRSRTTLAAAEVQEFLRGLLPDFTLTTEVVNDTYSPLVLAQGPSLVAAFAFASDDVRGSYEALYDGFKHVYPRHEKAWEDLDLSFVFCIDPLSPDPGEFSSSVETDTYFCRKFVLALRKPLGNSLASLPFLPLDHVQTGTMRPASASSFLRGSGVTPTLTSYLVASHQRGPEKIADDCIAGLFGDPHTRFDEQAPALVESAPEGDRARLESLEISHFRAYRETRRFDLSADVTVLYGPNGFGKTSFFDAVEFAITGSVDRLHKTSDAPFMKAARHLDGGPQDGKVALTFRRNKNPRTLVRHVGRRLIASVDGVDLERKESIAEITGATISSTVDGLVSLFRATHLFSQENQELGLDLRKHCQLPERVVSRLLAFEDYSNAAKKSREVRNELERRMRAAAKSIDDLESVVTQHEKELARLNPASDRQVSPSLLKKKVLALRQGFVSAGITVEDASLSSDMLRGWRALAEGEIARASQAHDRLRKALLAYESRPEHTQRLSELQATQTRLMSGLVEMKQALRELQASGDSRAKHLATLSLERERLAGQRDQYRWLSRAAAVYRELFARYEAARVRAEELAGRAIDAQGAQTRAEEELRRLQADDRSARQANVEGQARREVLLALLDVRTELVKGEARLNDLTYQLERTGANARLCQENLDRLLEEEAAVRQRMAAVVDDLATAQASQSELLRLLATLKTHIKDGTCLLCLHDYGDRAALLTRVDAATRGDGTISLRIDEARVRSDAHSVRASRDVHAAHMLTLQSSLLALRRSQASTTDEVTRCRKELEAFSPGLSIQEDRGEKFLTAALTEATQMLERASERLREREPLCAEAQTATTAAREATIAVSRESADAASILAVLESQLEELRTDSRLPSGGALGMDLAQIADVLNRLEEEFGTVQRQEAEVNEKQQRTLSEAIAAERDISAVQALLSQSRSQLVALEEVLSKQGREFRDLNLFASDRDAIIALVSQNAARQQELEDLKNEAHSLELVLDVATTAAAATSVRDSLRDSERLLAQLRVQRETLTNWLASFDALTRLIKRRQHDAITGFTREYGPRTSVIQRRLRAVYGFDDIDVQSEGSAINVLVRRGSEQLRPVDYFSQSQQQTLLLGLFLTACLSQSWSSFCPIFLDDPVTHFDDLNTYAFLDLVAGLIESNPGRHQFVISTCDERMLQIARQKFRHLPGGATFYRFLGIGGDGPMIHEDRVDAFPQSDARGN